MQKKIWIPAIVLTLLMLASFGWTIWIFNNSAEDGETSGARSEDVYIAVNQAAQSVGYEKEITHHAVRKGAHFSEYAVLGVLAALTFLCGGLFPFVRGAHHPKWYHSFLPLLSMIYPAFVAYCDEMIIQRMADGRGPQWMDVGIDTLGALTGALLVCLAHLLFYIIVRRGENRRKIK